MIPLGRTRSCASFGTSMSLLRQLGPVYTVIEYLTFSFLAPNRGLSVVYDGFLWVLNAFLTFLCDMQCFWGVLVGLWCTMVHILGILGTYTQLRCVHTMIFSCFSSFLRILTVFISIWSGFWGFYVHWTMYKLFFIKFQDLWCSHTMHVMHYLAEFWCFCRFFSNLMLFSVLFNIFTT